MNLLGLYAHGYEVSFALGHWNRLLRQVGFRIVDNRGIRFMPGMLRTLDLYLFCKIPSATGLTAPLIAPFACAPQISLDQKAWLPDRERRRKAMMRSPAAAAQTPAEIFHYPAGASSSLAIRKRLRDFEKGEVRWRPRRPSSVLSNAPI